MLALFVASSEAATVSFLVNPSTVDANSNGSVQGSEFNPVGSDDTTFSLVPVTNLDSTNARFLLSESRGIAFGGSGNSTIRFEFTVDQPILLQTYTLAESGNFSGDPAFNITRGSGSNFTFLSVSNSATPSGATLGFEGGTITVNAGVPHTFQVDADFRGPDALSFLASFNYASLGSGGLEGDYNGDGFVSQPDLDFVLLNWGDDVVPDGFVEANLPGGGPFDELMGQNELDGVLLNWGNGTPPTTAIPEPGTLAAMAGLGSLMLRRRG